MKAIGEFPKVPRPIPRSMFTTASIAWHNFSFQNMTQAFHLPKRWLGFIKAIWSGIWCNLPMSPHAQFSSPAPLSSPPKICSHRSRKKIKKTNSEKKEERNNVTSQEGLISIVTKGTLLAMAYAPCHVKAKNALQEALHTSCSPFFSSSAVHVCKALGLLHIFLNKLRL